MTEHLMTGGHALWSVMWVAKKNGKRVLVEHDCGNDLTEAVRIYSKAKSAGKHMATLRCKNVAFPPPKKYQPYDDVEVKKVRLSNGRMKKVKIPITVTPMMIVNRRGIVWCPYCREFRRFQKQDGFRFDGIYVDKAGYYCICGISTEAGMVRKYNPDPPRIVGRIRRTSGRRKRTRKRR